MYYYDKADLYDFNSANKLCFSLSNGLGGFTASSLINSSYRKQYGYLVASLNSPVLRKLLLTKIREKLVINGKTFDLDSQEYENHISTGNKYLDEFSYNYIPTWLYNINGTIIKKRLCPIYMTNGVAVTYEIMSNADAEFYYEPLFNYRDFSEISTKNDLVFEEIYKNGQAILTPLKNKDLKIKFIYSDGAIYINENKYTDPFKFGYDLMTGDERLDTNYTPFKVKVDLKCRQIKYVSVICTIDKMPKYDAFGIMINYDERISKLIRQSKITDSLGKDLVVSADSFIANRKSTNFKTILAGLPWFSDWGRDTMISLTGLTLVTRRFKDAKEILLSFKIYEKNGLIPNMFPLGNDNPIYNTSDASLWYIYACYKYYEYTNDLSLIEELYKTLESIILNYKEGTLNSIKMDSDYLISSGADLDQVTWMDVKVNDVVMTPRHGKCVEINALWYNALMIMSCFSKLLKQDDFYLSLAREVKKSFNEKFYNKNLKSLYDVIDELEVKTNKNIGNNSDIRPNQIYSISLPFKVLDEKYFKQVFDTVTLELYNTLGLRSLSPNNPNFKGVYNGTLEARDKAYHNGTTWAYLIGAYIDSYKVIDNNKEEIKKLVYKFIPHLYEGCINGIAEVFDGLGDFTTKGCYNQAWSVAELLRAYYENYLLEK